MIASGHVVADHLPMANPNDPVALAATFSNAHYTVPELGTAGVLHVGALAPALERAMPARSYGFITAWNPGSQSSRPDNDRADAALVAELDALQIRRHRAFASDPEGGHREDGWLVLDLPLAGIDRLARRFGQDGVLAWRAGLAVRLRLYHSRPDTAGVAAPWIDWIGRPRW